MRALSGLLLALLLAVCGAGGADGPRVLVGFDYRLHYWPQHADRVPVIAEAAREALPRLEQALGLTLQERVDIHLAHSAEEFRALTGGMDPDRVLGAALTRPRRVVLQPLRGERLRELVVHELTHILLDDATAAYGAPAPRWLHEGLAKYAAQDFSVKDRMLLIEAVNRGRFIPLEELEQAFSGPPEKVSLAYAEAYTLVDFLANYPPGEGLEPFLRHLGQVGDVSRALVRAYGLTPEQLAEQWQRHLIMEHVGRSTAEQITPLVWGAMVLMFVVAVVVRLRHAAAIRRRLEQQEQESLRAGSGPGGAGREENPHEPDPDSLR